MSTFSRNLSNLPRAAQTGYETIQTIRRGTVGQGDKVLGLSMTVILTLVVLGLLFFISSKRDLLCAQNDDATKVNCALNYLWMGILAGVCTVCIFSVIIALLRRAYVQGSVVV